MPGRDCQQEQPLCSDHRHSGAHATCLQRPPALPSTCNLSTTTTETPEPTQPVYGDHRQSRAHATSLQRLDALHLPGPLSSDQTPQNPPPPSAPLPLPTPLPLISCSNRSKFRNCKYFRNSFRFPSPHFCPLQDATTPTQGTRACVRVFTCQPGVPEGARQPHRQQGDRESFFQQNCLQFSDKISSRPGSDAVSLTSCLPTFRTILCFHLEG